MYNYSKLLGAIREKGFTQDQIARILGISGTSLTAKLKNKSQFKQDEMREILTVLGLPIDAVSSYFFQK